MCLEMLFIVRVVVIPFWQKRDFSHVTATMHLYDANHEVQSVDVKVDGKLVYLGKEPHFVISVFSS